MAIIYSKNEGDHHYEVRQAGNSIRLYTNGVFHSQWNTSRPLAGQLWDLLFLPALYSEKFPYLTRCLVLGVGGGAVINALLRFTQTTHIDAIDLDPIHLEISRKYFVKQHGSVNYVCCDAVEFVKKKATRKYDFILEDIFGGADDDKGDARRPIDVSELWLKNLNQCLTKSGVLIINFENEAQARKALKPKILEKTGFLGRRFLTHPSYENCIAVCFRDKPDDTRFESNFQCLERELGRASLKLVKFDLIKR